MFEARSEMKAAVFFADGFEEIEALTVTDILFRAGLPTVTVSIKDKPIVTSSHDLTVITDTTIGEADLSDIDILVLPGGGPGTANLAACTQLSDIILRFAEEGRTLAAICAAPSIYAGLGLLKGKKAACHPSVEQKLTDGGAELVFEPVVMDGNLITSRGMGCAIDFALAIVSRFIGQAEADRIAKAIVYDR